MEETSLFFICRSLTIFSKLSIDRWDKSKLGVFLFLVLTRLTARFQSVQDFHKGANRRGISSDTTILSARSLPTDMDTFVDTTMKLTLPWSKVLVEDRHSIPWNTWMPFQVTKSWIAMSHLLPTPYKEAVSKYLPTRWRQSLSICSQESWVTWNYSQLRNTLTRNDHDVLLQLLNSLFQLKTSVKARDS